MRITLAQLNPIVGDIKGNIAKINLAIGHAVRDHADLLVFPELFLTGYPPRDLLLMPDVLEHCNQGITEIMELSTKTPSLGILIGFPEQTTDKKGLYNAVTLIENGKRVFTQYKSLLPYYDVFDESRYFNPALQIETHPYKGENLAILICEDAWGIDPITYQHYSFDPLDLLVKKKASLLITVMASPYEIGKSDFRRHLFESQCRKFNLPGIFINQVGGQDELIFDGKSLCIDEKGEVLYELAGFKEEVVTLDLNTSMTAPAPKKAASRTQEVASIWHVEDFRTISQPLLEDALEALSLGLRDYVSKCGFHKVLLGLSGGIDSALVACIATKALGPDRVLGVSLPSKYSSKGSKDDAEALAKNLSIQYQVLPIGSVVQCAEDQLVDNIKDLNLLLDWSHSEILNSLTEQNLQARIRGLLLMALSNQMDALLLSTGNKSELAVGYCTLYGDMNGAINVLSDVPKTLVYQLARYINRDKVIIPESTLTKAPSAELKPNQKDQDTLPAYEVLDGILIAFLDENKSVQAIIDSGYDKHTVHWVLNAIKRTEYKRRQACPGLKISSKAFGIGRRIPVASKYIN